MQSQHFPHFTPAILKEKDDHAHFTQVQVTDQWGSNDFQDVLMISSSWSCTNLHSSGFRTTVFSCLLLNFQALNDVVGIVKASFGVREDPFTGGMKVVQRACFVVMEHLSSQFSESLSCTLGFRNLDHILLYSRDP